MTSFARPTASRAVHIRLTPRASNLGESREVLRLISQFGPVEYYKSLKYDALPVPHTALVIFKEESAAQTCLNRSPIRFRMGKAPVDEQPVQTPVSNEQTEDKPMPAASPARPSRAPFGMGSTRSMSTNRLPDPPARPVQLLFEPPPQPTLEFRLFQIMISPARVNFRDHINMGHYHGSFPIENKSIAQQDLAKSVPTNGLSCVDWRLGEKPWRLIEREKSKEHDGPQRRRSLRELWEEGERKRNG